MGESKYVPIDCGDYDYLEVACMDQYDVEISANEQSFSGIATNLEIELGEEFLILRVGSSSRARIRIDQIDHLRVISRPCRFQEHTFGQDFTKFN